MRIRFSLINWFGLLLTLIVISLWFWYTSIGSKIEIKKFIIIILRLTISLVNLLECVRLLIICLFIWLSLLIRIL